VDSAVVELTGVLRDTLAANDRAPVDPASVPLRFSSMKLIAQSPLHYWHACQNQFEETLSMRLGTGAHAILFGQPYVVWTGKTRNGKAWDQFEADHAGQVILSQSEIAKSQAMADAIRSHQVASRLLFTDTVLEKRIDWTWQGRAFRSTPDAAGRTHIVDLKCLRSADPEKVRWQSRNMAYETQAAVYRRALNSTGLHNIKECFLVVVENKAPWPVSVFRFSNSALEHGDRQSAAWLEQVLACEASGKYSGYVEGIVDLDVPAAMDDLIFAEDEDE
jgi:hypothetical protein